MISSSALLIKQPQESLLFDFDFSDRLAQGVTLSTVASVTATPSGLTIGTPAVSTTAAQARISGGTAETYYRVTAVVTDSGGFTREGDGDLWVVDLNEEEVEALYELVTYLRPSEEPTLTTAELLKLLRKYTVASVWEASTVYSYGDVIIPSADKRVGSRFRLVSLDGNGRTSGTTEPAWTNAQSARYTDGNLVWEEVGREPDALIDVRKACEQGWRAKAAKAAQEFDYADADHKEMASQLLENCLKMVKQFKVAGAA